MKTFSATHLNKHAQEVFAAAKEDGSSFIEHDRYGGGFFSLVWHSTAIKEVDPAIAKLPLHPVSDQQ